MEYINNLVENHPKTKKCIELDIVLESGAANGSYHIGCLLYILLLEKKNILKINRISGSSVGAIAGFYYFINSLQEFKDDYIKIRECFKQNLNFSILKTILEKKINSLSEEELNQLNNRLYIVYHDVQQKKQILKNTFTDKKELLSTLLKSCHIPYLVNSEMFYKEDDKEYFDGGIPYIFHERERGEKKILYINISKINKLSCLFCIKREKNNYGRLLEGALDAHEFFIYEKNSKFCSYINEWKMTDFTILRLKQLVFKLLFYFIIIIHFVGKNIFPYISKYYFIQMLTPIFINFYYDFLLYYCL